MSYLGVFLRPSTWEVRCDTCRQKVKGEKPPRTWLTDAERFRVKHYCPKCRRKRKRGKGRR